MPWSFFVRPTALLAALLFICSCRRESTPTSAQATQARATRERVGASDQARMENHLANAYTNQPQHDPRWDASIREAIKLAVAQQLGLAAPGEGDSRIAALTGGALAEGCRDPYVRYLRFRYGQTESLEAKSKEATKMVMELQMAGYPPDVLTRAYCFAAKSSHAYWSSLEKSTQELLQEITNHRLAAVQSILLVYADETFPAAEIYFESQEMLQAVERNRDHLTKCWDWMEPVLNEHWKKTIYPTLLKAEYHYDLGWAARGGGYASEVTDEGAKVFEKEMSLAEGLFREAWRKDNTRAGTARWMIELCVCRSKPREEMELWFDRAMIADPGAYRACFTKLRFLEPKWGGSAEAMIAFGHQCLTNQAYKGRAVATLADAYQVLEGYLDDPRKLAQFYANPKIWKDIEATYAEVERRDPGATWYHNKFARSAWLGGHWDVLARELEAIREPNYEDLGGEGIYKRMIVDARQHAKP